MVVMGSGRCCAEVGCVACLVVVVGGRLRSLPGLRSLLGGWWESYMVEGQVARAANLYNRSRL